MRRRNRSIRLDGRIVLLLLLLAGSVLPSGAQTDRFGGRSFLVAHPYLSDGSFSRIVIAITAIDGGVTTVENLRTGATATRTLAAGDTWEYSESRQDAAVPEGREGRYERHSIAVNSSGRLVVSAYADADYLAEAWTVPPISEYGTRHHLVSLEQPITTGGVGLIVAARDSTIVRITPTVATEGNGLPGLSFAVRLDRGDVYQVVPKIPELTDLSGTYIESSEPVTVISGHAAGTLFGLGAANPMIETIPPDDALGRRYFSRQFPGQQLGRYKVTAGESAATINVNGVDLLTLGPRESDWISLFGALIFESTSPVSIAQFQTHVRDTLSRQDGDPSMTILSPVDRWQHRWTWSTPNLRERISVGPGGGDFLAFEHRVLVTMASDDTVEQLELDGVDVRRFLSSSFAGTGLRSAILAVDIGRHELVSSEPIAVQLVGRNSFDAYTLPAGLPGPPLFRIESIDTILCDSTFAFDIGIDNLSDGELSIDRWEQAGTGFVSSLVDSTIGPRSTGILRIVGTVPPDSIVSGSHTIEARGDFDLRRVRIGTIRIQGPPPAIEFDSREIVIDRAGDPGASLFDTIRVTNRGAHDRLLVGADLPPPFLLVEPSILPDTIAPDESRLIVVRYDVDQGGQRDSAAGTLTFEPCGSQEQFRTVGSTPDFPPLEIESDTIVIRCPDDTLTTTTVILRNRSDAPVELDSIRFSGPISGDVPEILPSASESAISIRWLSHGTGDTTGTITMYRGDSRESVTIRVVREVRINRITSLTESIDFGTIRSCDGNVSIGTIRFVNDGPESVAASSFRSRSAAVAIGRDTIQPGDTVSIDVRLENPMVGELFVDTLTVTFEPCGIEIALPISGRIVAPVLSGPTTPINLLVKRPCDTTVTGTIRIENTGTAADTIVAVLIDAEWIEIGDHVGDVIASGSSLSIPVVIDGLQPASSSGSVTVIGSCGDSITIEIRRVVSETSVRSLRDTIRLSVGRSASVSGTIRLVNAGTTDATVNLAESVVDVNGLRVTQSAPVPVSALDTISFGYTYDLSEPVPSTGLLRIPYSAIDGCADTLDLVVIIDVDPVALTWSLSSAAGDVDNVVPIAVRVDEATRTDRNGVARISVTWPSRGLFAIDDEVQEYGTTIISSIQLETSGRSTTLRFEARGQFDAGDTIATIPYLILLADETSWDLELDVLRMHPDGQSLPDSSVGGNVSVLGICSIDGLRLFSGLFAGRLRPNPSDSEVTIDLDNRTTEPVEFRWLVFDAQGSILLAGDGDLAPGTTTMTIDVSPLRSGLYHVVLENGREQTVRPFLVRR